MEYRLLTRLNQHNLQYLNLYKSQLQAFTCRNRYPEVLPFTHNYVQLKETNDDLDKFSKYVNASFVNVSFY